jgi:hypothetical protein
LQRGSCRRVSTAGLLASFDRGHQVRAQAGLKPDPTRDLYVRSSGTGCWFARKRERDGLTET